MRDERREMRYEIEPELGFSMLASIAFCASQNRPSASCTIPYLNLAPKFGYLSCQITIISTVRSLNRVSPRSTKNLDLVGHGE